MSESPDSMEASGEVAPSLARPRRHFILIAVVLALIIAGVFILWSRRTPALSPPAAAGTAPNPGAGHAATPAAVPRFPGHTKGNISATLTVVELTPAAQVQAEKFRCVCGCRMSLGECYCSKTPGSVDMKRFLQDLVKKELTPAEIEKGMVEKYGPGVMP